MSQFISAPMAGEFLHCVPTAVNRGDYVITITEGGHTWGPHGFAPTWEVAEVHTGEHPTRYVYVDGSHTYVNTGSVMVFRPA